MVRCVIKSLITHCFGLGGKLLWNKVINRKLGLVRELIVIKRIIFRLVQVGEGEAGNTSIHPLWLPSWVPPPPPNGLVFFAYDFHSSKYLRSFFKNSKPYKLVVPFPPKAPTLQRNHQTRRNQYPYCQRTTTQSGDFNDFFFVRFRWFQTWKNPEFMNSSTSHQTSPRESLILYDQDHKKSKYLQLFTN